MFLFKIFFPFALFFSELMSIITPISATLITISSGGFGPYQTYCANQTIDIKITSSSRLYSSYVTVYAGLSQSNYSYSREYSSFNLSANGTKTQSIVLPTREYLTSNGMYIKLVVTYHDVLDGPSATSTTSFVIYPTVLNHDINPEEHIFTSYKIERASYILTAGRLRTIDESYLFPDYIDYFNIDTYHRLDLDSVSFTYVGASTFSYSSAYLQIYDDDNVFPYIHKNNDGYFLVPLIVNKTANKYSFAFKNQFYVNPISAQMSFDPEEGFVLTRYFYLPKNGREDLIDKNMNVYLYGGGLASSNIRWNLTYLASQNLLGDCSDSDYCIVGEQKNG